eukprot:TRINITY_DN12856_c0_g1_i1.p1 TRINITY_DN12856_c0_g1~~TRINITY_DN12856_c0_g1_i1.p1  ORF type:complete len:125 (+),score=4.49 TRINITY_DN12856_c0_g1_i1:128-502(+)
MTSVDVLYRICPSTEWTTALTDGFLLGGDLDKRDGYIHLSTLQQVPGTLARFFRGQDNLFLLEIDSASLGDGLKWESPPTDGSVVYPHLYGRSGENAGVKLNFIRRVTKILLVDGKHSWSWAGS